jgi:hypothetical protein
MIEGDLLRLADCSKRNINALIRYQSIKNPSTLDREGFVSILDNQRKVMAEMMAAIDKLDQFCSKSAGSSSTISPKDP